MQGNDVRLPWQYTVLIVYGLIAAIILLYILRCIVPPVGLGPGNPVAAYAIGIPYLCLGLVIGPKLLRGGRRTVQQWREEEGLSRSNDRDDPYASLGQPVPTSGRNAVAGAIACAILFAMVVFRLTLGDPSPGARIKLLCWAIGLPVAFAYLLIRIRSHRVR